MPVTIPVIEIRVRSRTNIKVVDKRSVTHYYQVGEALYVVIGGVTYRFDGDEEALTTLLA